MKMISFAYLSVLCLTYAAALEEVQQTGSTPAPEEVPGRELTNAGYVIRYGDQLHRYPVVLEPLVRSVRPSQRNQIDANAIRTNEIESEEDGKGRPLFYFTTYETVERRPQDLPTSRPYIEIRKKRAVDDSEVPESSKVSKLRKKRTYCGKCGGGGGGGYYAVPVTYAVYPVYYGGGGGGKGCNTCGGYGGGGGGGSYSYSSASAQSSSGSFGWGK